VAFAEVNWGRIESWHPAPEAFYTVGALFDVGVSPLGILTGIFGPARRVTAYGTVLHPDRVTKEGVPFHVTTPDFIVAALEFQAGPVVRLTTDFYVSNETTRQTGIEFHGDLGSLYLESWSGFRSPVSFAPFGEPFAPVPLVREPYPGIPWGRGVWETATALRAGRPHRFTGEQAAHITEILGAVAESARTAAPVAITSTFPPPAPMEWAVASSE
jgi:predicted dehydrogenase